MKIYIKRPSIQGAWLWITKGYVNAWESHGFIVEYYDSFEQINSKNTPYYIMVRDWDIKEISFLKVLEKAERVFFFVQPSVFPEPWGRHPNFISNLGTNIVNKIDKMENIYLWTFANINQKFYPRWTKKIHTVPLAFDSISYRPIPDEKYAFDICFIGGWANNGFNEKKKIMLNFFGELKKLKIKHGIFINKNLTHEQENKILYNSKIAINIHDAYQHALGLDINERTFKSLGLNGFLINDNVRQIKTIFPEESYDIPIAKDPVTMRELVEFYLDKNLDSIKMYNRQMILQKHTYYERVREMLSW